MSQDAGGRQENRSSRRGRNPARQDRSETGRAPSVRVVPDTGACTAEDPGFPETVEERRRSRPAVTVAWAVVLAILAQGPARPAAGKDAVKPAGREVSVTIVQPAPSVDPLALHVAVIARRAVGSAFWLEPGVLVTAAHLVRDMSPGDRVMLRADSAGGMAGEATLIAVSREIDLALLRPPPGFRPPGLPGDAAITADLSVSAAGSLPMRGPSAPAARRRIDGMITGGPISIPGLGSGPIVRLSGIAPGFSGGPVLDAHGRLVGMIVAVRPQPQTATESAFRPRRLVSAAGAEEAFVLSAAVLRAEVRRLLSASSAVPQ